MKHVGGGWWHETDTSVIRGHCYRRRWVASLLPAPPLSLRTQMFLVYLPAGQKKLIQLEQSL